LADMDRMSAEDRTKWERDLATFGTAACKTLDDGSVVYVSLASNEVFWSPFWDHPELKPSTD
jgi:hypothetical protein